MPVNVLRSNFDPTIRETEPAQGDVILREDAGHGASGASAGSKWKAALPSVVAARGAKAGAEHQPWRGPDQQLLQIDVNGVAHVADLTDARR